MSSVAGGIVATTWFVLRATTSSASDGHSPHENSVPGNPFNGIHATDRHPSWSGRRDGDRQSGSSNDSEDAARASNGRGVDGKPTATKEGRNDTNLKDGEQRGSANMDGGAEGGVEREWPVFGSNGVGGRFGAF